MNAAQPCVLCALEQRMREVAPPPPPLERQLVSASVSGWVSGFCMAVSLMQSRAPLPICTAHLEIVHTVLRAHGLEPSFAIQGFGTHATAAAERPS